MILRERRGREGKEEGEREGGEKEKGEREGGEGRQGGERGGKGRGKGEREKHVCGRHTLIGCLLHVP